jgi:hypothetical protein
MVRAKLEHDITRLQLCMDKELLRIHRGQFELVGILEGPGVRRNVPVLGFV